LVPLLGPSLSGGAARTDHLKKNGKKKMQKRRTARGRGC